ncbi:MAG TPA: hypothetical protein VGM91_02010 [Conexibacter sp.]|jgi:hypothetical protein
MSRLTFLRHAPVLLALAVGLAACGGSGGSQQADAIVRAAKPRAAHRAHVQTVTTPTVTVPPPTTTTAPPPTTVTTPGTTPTTTSTTPQNGGATTPSQTTRTTPSATRTTTAPPTAPPTQTTATTPSTQSGTAATQTSCGTVANGFLSGVQATGTDCGDATGVARTWLGAVGDAGPESDVVAGSFACSGRRDGDDVDVTCISNDGRRVSFSAHN